MVMRRMRLAVVSAIGAALTTMAIDVSEVGAEEVPRLRPLSEGLDALIAYGTRESSSFRALVDSLDASDLLVFVESSRRLEGHLAGKLRFVSTIARFRVVSIVIDGTLSPARRVAALAHELQHACEVAADSEVRSEAALGRLYGRIGRHRRASDVYETERAIQVGQQVLKEVSGRGSIESALTASRPTPAPAVTSEP
ncbi:MAG: hypothetical protein U0Q12_17445 [Vicinamibacterales bacterium]